MFDFVSLGESLVDFTPYGKNELGFSLYAQNPGGAPSNVLAMCNILGASTAFIGKVGDDSFGHFLSQNMIDAGIDCSALIHDPLYLTTLAYVMLNDKGDRSFSFYRKNGADTMLHEDELPIDMLKNTQVFHFGSVSLTNNPSRSSTLKAVNIAKENGALISYDPNYRPLLWKDEETAKKVMTEAIPLCDILKISEEELVFLTGETDIIKGSDILLSYGPSLIVVTKGAQGAFYKTCKYSDTFYTYDVKTIDTTGAGDAFLGALLWKLVIDYKAINKNLILDIKKCKMDEAIDFANATGSLATTSKGAIPSMPKLQSIYDCVKTCEKLCI